MKTGSFCIVLALAVASASGFGKTVKVSEFGYDPTDSTSFIRAAIESDADTVVFDRQSGPWFACSMKYVGLKGKKLLFEKGVEVRAKPGEFKPVKGPNICLFSFFNCTDCLMSGYGATIRMDRDAYDKPPYEHSEHRHILHLRGVRNFRVEGLTLTESGGDGVFIGGSFVEGKFQTAENVTLKDVVCDRNYRQGLSVISAKGLLCEGCSFSNTGGTPPQSGVDLEPNQPYELLQDITFRNCRFENNKGRGLEFYLGALDSSTPPVTARLENCRMTGNVNGFAYQQARGGSVEKLPQGGLVELHGCTMEKSTHSGINILDKPQASAKIVFKECKLVDSCTVSTNAPDVNLACRLADTPPPDGVDFGDLSIIRSRARAWISDAKTDFTSSGVKDISGEVSVTTGGETHKVKLDDAWRAAFAPLPPDGPTRLRVAFDGKVEKVVDPVPGEMRPLEDVRLAGTQRLLVYADRARKIRFRMRHVKLSAKRPITLNRITVVPFGETVKKPTRLAVPGGEEEFEIAFTAKKSGFHVVTIMAGRQAVTVTAADAPVAVEITNGPVAFGMTKTGCVRFFADQPFSLFAGADSYEKASVRLTAPAGKVCWEHPLLVDWQRYQGTAAEGLWKLDLNRPKGMSRTVRIDLAGVPGCSFQRTAIGGDVNLCKEKEIYEHVDSYCGGGRTGPDRMVRARGCGIQG